MNRIVEGITDILVTLFGLTAFVVVVAIFAFLVVFMTSLALVLFVTGLVVQGVCQLCGVDIKGWLSRNFC